ncbi:hypothetical protein [Brevundimonas sp. DWR2-3-1b1]|uniref:hypothetical protein n=1 Tax=unclassified Brevundimonas TaxID=2622653 RepID=UPI003CF56709
MNRALILSVLLLASCNTTSKVAPEPVVQIVEVKVPVAVACSPDIGPEPAYVDTPEAIAMAPDIFARTVLLIAGRVQRIARDDVKTAALDECRRPPAVPPRPG